MFRTVRNRTERRACGRLFFSSGRVREHLIHVRHGSELSFNVKALLIGKLLDIVGLPCYLSLRGLDTLQLSISHQQGYEFRTGS
jgi:hypothetical protein